MTDSPRLGTSTILSENDAFRISRHTLKPGETTGEHHHPHDYVVIPLTSSTVTVTSGGEQNEFSMTKAETYSRQAGITHSLTNSGVSTVDFVEIEFLAE
jgi:beta-alanine degradation protein BauB